MVSFSFKKGSSCILSHDQYCETQMNYWSSGYFQKVLSSKLRMFVLKDGTSSGKWGLNVDAIVKGSRIMSSCTKNFRWKLERFGCWKLLMRYQVVFISKLDLIRLPYVFLSALIKLSNVFGYLLWMSNNNGLFGQSLFHWCFIFMYPSKKAVNHSLEVI